MPLRWLFLDMNSYFASVEQQDRPELRGQPIAVAPVMAETTCCIAASYEAKKFGVKTGTNVAEARRLCPGIQIVEARPPLYVAVHHRIVRAVESCLPVDKTVSIDEMVCRLTGAQREPNAARRLAENVKQTIYTRVGEALRCSVGLGPNLMLAKVASDMQKPDGLTTVHSEELPHRLHGLKLTDFPGVGPRMEQRLHRCGIATVEQFCAASEERLARVWGSRILARQWWLRLRGEDVPETPTHRRSVGHSHVLPPKLRNSAGMHQVLTCLIHKAATRLRGMNYWAREISVQVSYVDGPSWHAYRKVPPCRDTLTFLQAFRSIWDGRPRAGTPLKVGTVLQHLEPTHCVPRSLFAQDAERLTLSETMDRMDERFGKFAVHFAGMFEARDEAPDRIAFTHVPEIREEIQKPTLSRLRRGHTPALEPDAQGWTTSRRFQ